MSGLKLDMKTNEFSLENVKSLGQAKKSHEAKYISNGLIDNIIPYDPSNLNNFYYVSNAKDLPNSCADDSIWAMNNKTYDVNCNNDLSANTLDLTSYNSNWSGTMYKTVAVANNNKKISDIKLSDVQTYCYQRELCKNQRNVSGVLLQKGKAHSVAVSNYLDDKTNYNIGIIDTINLSIGILLILMTSYTFRK
jgi:hypothetical protein